MKKALPAKRNEINSAEFTYSRKVNLFERVVSILEQAKTNVVRAVNSSMVIAYWLIGREIVQELQAGQAKAAYGEAVVNDLAQLLTARYGQGFSVTNLKNFRTFYQVYTHHQPAIGHPVGDQFKKMFRASTRNCHPTVDNFEPSFHPNLTWSHYRALMRVENNKARQFYEEEAVACSWTKRDLERQIHSFYYERLLASIRMYEDLYQFDDNNPTIGLIMCAKKNETIAKYSVLKESKQLFASKYMLYLPTEKELALELEREQRLIRDRLPETQRSTKQKNKSKSKNPRFT